MRYALTFTTPETYSWEDTDTIIMETDTNPLDINLDTLAGCLAESSGYSYSKSDWSNILGNGSCFVRNCDDIDIRVERY